MRQQITLREAVIRAKLRGVPIDMGDLSDAIASGRLTATRDTLADLADLVERDLDYVPILNSGLIDDYGHPQRMPTTVNADDVDSWLAELAGQTPKHDKQGGRPSGRGLALLDQPLVEKIHQMWEQGDFASPIPLSKLPEKGIIYSRNYIDRLIKEGRFPKPVYLSPRRRAFVESEVDAWIKERADKRDEVAA